MHEQLESTSEAVFWVVLEIVKIDTSAMAAQSSGTGIYFFFVLANKKNRIPCSYDEQIMTRANSSLPYTAQEIRMLLT